MNSKKAQLLAAAQPATPADKAVVEREFSVFWCESQKYLVTVQCIYYCIFYSLAIAGSLQVFIKMANVSSSEWLELGFPCEIVNCDKGGFPGGAEEQLQQQLLIQTAMSAVQCLLLITAAVLVRIRRFQERWFFISTTLLVLVVALGAVPLDIVGIAQYATYENTGFFNNALWKDTVLATVLVGSHQREIGLTSLKLFCLAPRFLPYSIVAGCVLVAGVVAEMILNSEVFGQLSFNSSAWGLYLSTYNLRLGTSTFYNNITGAAIPIAILWIFERMLKSRFFVWSSPLLCVILTVHWQTAALLSFVQDVFLLQRTLELKSNALDKAAHPFALRTMQDWLATLNAANEVVEDGDPEAILRQRRASSQFSVTLRPIAERQKHPWELDSGDLVVGSTIGSGGFGQVFKGQYKGSNVAVKTLFEVGADIDQDASNLLQSSAAEAEALSRLRHVNMMRFYGICYLPEQNCIAMITELCDRDLRAWIDETGVSWVLLSVR